MLKALDVSDNSNSTFCSFDVITHSTNVFLAKVCSVVERPCLYAARVTSISLLICSFDLSSTQIANIFLSKEKIIGRKFSVGPLALPVF